jgi:hypothetical protein
MMSDAEHDVILGVLLAAVEDLQDRVAELEKNGT